MTTNGALRANAASVNPLDVRLRPAQAGDEAFLRRVHDAGRAAEFEPLRAMTGEATLDAVMAQQYAAQRDFYFQVHDLARYAVIEWCGVPIGRLYADFRDHEIRILDFMLLPEVRGKQIGAIVLRGLCGAAAADAKPVTLGVGPLNRRARVFYERHGFEASGVLNGMIEMIWRPAPPR